MSNTISLPKNTSFSARETLQRCARSYFLSRIAKAPKRPALWSVGGSAVHETTEHYDLMSVVGNEDVSKENIGRIWETYFNTQLEQAFEREPNENLWGRSQAEPIEVWRRQGLQFVQSYIDWRERSPWTIWTTPDGQPAIELDISGKLPGCPVEIKAYLDRIFHDPVFDQLWILDLKSGKRPPKSPDQFETYAALVRQKYGVAVGMGVPFMNRKGGPGKPYDLSEVSVEGIGEAYGKAWAEVEGYAASGNWPANTNECFICDVQASCAAVNGPKAPNFDPASPGYRIPF